jgi:hypothetical protein
LQIAPEGQKGTNVFLVSYKNNPRTEYVQHIADWSWLTKTISLFIQLFFSSERAPCKKCGYTVEVKPVPSFAHSLSNARGY